MSRPSIEKLLGIVRDVGDQVSPGATVLDFGCGAGNDVQAMIARGFDAFGCDVRFKPGPHVEALERAGRIRRIGSHPYRLPFADSAFDFVYSENVLEHVADYPGTLAELARVTRSSGCTLHLFSSRLRPIESHVFVPMASVWRSRHWLLLWAILGIRKREQRGMCAKDVAFQNQRYLVDNTYYHSRRRIEDLARPYFDVRWVEKEMLRYTRLSPIARAFPVPIVARLVGEFQTRALLLSPRNK